MKILSKVSTSTLFVAIITAGMLVGCSSTTNPAEATSQPTPRGYNIIDHFQDPSGNHVVLYCRNANLYVGKDGSREGSLQFFFKHEMCQGN